MGLQCRAHERHSKDHGRLTTTCGAPSRCTQRAGPTEPSPPQQLKSGSAPKDISETDFCAVDPVVPPHGCRGPCSGPIPMDTRAARSVSPGSSGEPPPRACHAFPHTFPSRRGLANGRPQPHLSKWAATPSGALTNAPPSPPNRVYSPRHVPHSSPPPPQGPCAGGKGLFLRWDHPSFPYPAQAPGSPQPPHRPGAGLRFKGGVPPEGCSRRGGGGGGSEEGGVAGTPPPPRVPLWSPPKAGQTF